MTPQELRNSILQFAIQGKLVEQRMEEGTAEDLYRQIQAEKQKLIKVRTIKKEKPLPSVTDDEKPFDIPENWIWTRIGNIGSWNAGATPLRTNPQYYGGNIPWLKTGDLNDGYITEVPEYISTLALEKTSIRLNPIGSVLMAMYGATIGKLGILSIEATTNQACCACIPFDGIYNKYLFYYLMARRTAFIKMAEGGAQPNISKEKIVNALIAIPPLNEQKRIVSKIEELLPCIDGYEHAWSMLEDFNKRFPTNMQKSILQTAIQGKLVEQRQGEGTGDELHQQIQAEKQRLIKAGTIKKEMPLKEITEDEKPFDIPENWEWMRLDDIVQKNIKRGKSPTYIALSNTLVFAQKCNVKTGGINMTLAQYLDESTLHKYPKEEFMHHMDIVVNSTGGGTLGRIGIFRDSDNPTNQQIVPDSHVTVIRVSNHILPEYVYYYLKISQPYLESMGDGSTNQTELKPYVLRSLVVPIPPLAEQKRIVAKLEEILPLCEKLKR